MSARFVVVLLRRLSSIGLGLVAVWSCSVFPDEATLPARPAAPGSGGDSTAARAGAGGDNDVSPGGDGGGTVGEGGGLGMGGARAAAGTGGEPAAAGAGGVPPTVCVNLEQRVAIATADIWIDAAKQGTSHGNEPTLSIVASTAAERRALMGFTLPPVPPGKVLNRASLALHLETNADVGLAARHLGLHQLTHGVSESHATWLNYDNGGGAKWAKPGGDFGVELSTAALRAGMSSGTVTFEVTDAVRQLMASVAIPLSLIVLEPGSPPPPSAELAFTSREGDASGIPALILDFCDQ